MQSSFGEKPPSSFDPNEKIKHNEIQKRSSHREPKETPLPLVDGFRAISCLRRLDISGNKITINMAAVLYDYFSQACNLSDVNIARCSLNETTSSRILLGFANGGGGDTLLKMDARDNQIILSSQEFCGILQQFSQLKYLNLSGNRCEEMKELRHKSFCQCLSQLSSLKALSLSCIKLSAVAGKVLLTISSHMRLMVLDMSNCFLSSDCEPDIIKLLTRTTSLEFIMMHGFLWAADKPKDQQMQKGDNTRTCIEKIAKDKNINLIFDGHYEGIDITYC